MQRVAVVGSSGSGKTWVASRLASIVGAEHIELDAVHHGPGWAPRPADDMRRVLDACCPAGGAWVADGNYDAKGGELVRARAEVVLWLDPPRALAMWRVARRSLGRIVFRRELWNGNRESLRALLAADERSILRWAWTQHAERRRTLGRCQDDRWVRLTDRASVKRFLEQAGASGGRAPDAPRRR